MTEMQREILESLKKAMEELPEGKLEFLRGYAEGIVAQRMETKEPMEKAG